MCVIGVASLRQRQQRTDTQQARGIERQRLRSTDPGHARLTLRAIAHERTQQLDDCGIDALDALGIDRNVARLVEELQQLIP